MPRRWVSVDGDPTNQRGPFKTVDVALNLWGKVEGDAADFYAESGALPQTGKRPMTVSIEQP
jgi:hypothetical protein